jgi:SAM-dependent methyltransferase
MSHFTNFLNKFLSLYWLRPENAIFTANLATAVSKSLPEMEKLSSLEVACGDGLFSFITLGGEFHVKFDVYSSVMEKEIESSSPDIFDYFDEVNYEPAITKRPDCSITLGVDMKSSLLAKANLLGHYGQLELSDIEKKPIHGSYDVVFLFSSIYHFHNPKPVLSKLASSLSNQGKLLVNTFTPGITDFYQTLKNLYGDRFSGFLERGMTSLWPSLYSVAEWEEIFESSGFIVDNIIPVVDKNFACVWNIGARPFAPHYIRLYNIARSCNENAAFQVKQEYMEVVKQFSKDFDYTSGVDNSVGHLFVLSKKN